MRSWQAKLELGVVLAALVLALFAGWEAVTWIGRPFPGFLWAEALTVNQLAMRPTWEGHRLGIKGDEHLVAVDGQPVLTSQDLQARLRTFVPGELHRFQFEGRAPLELRIQRFTLDDWIAIALLPLLSGLGYLALGVLVRRARPEHPDAARLFWFCLPAAVFNLSIFDNATSHTLRLAWVLALALIPAGMVPMASLFSPEPLTRRQRLLVGGFAVLCALAGVVYYLLGRMPGPLWTMWLVLQLLVLTGYLWGLVGLVRTRSRQPDLLVQRQVELVLLGWLLSTGPSQLWSVGNVLGIELYPFSVASALFLLFPAYLAFAVLRHRLFDVSLAIRRSVTYTLVALTLGGGYLGVYLGVSRTTGQWPLWLHLALTGAIAVAFAPLRDAVRRRLNRYLFRTTYDFPAIVSRFGRLTRQTLDVEAVKEAFRRELLQALEPGSLLIEENQTPAVTQQLPRGELVVPLTVGGEALGRVTLGLRPSGVPFGPQDRDLIHALCQQLSFTLRTSQLLVELRTQLEAQERTIRQLLESEDVIARLSQMDRLRREAFSQASHDLRAPLASISLTCQSLLRGHLGPMDEGVAQEVRVVLGNTQALGALIDGILDTARHEAHKLVLELRPVPLGPVCDEVVALMEPLARAADARLELALPAGLPPLLAEPRRLRQVLLNLLSNAVKYTPDGTVRLLARATPRGVELQVADTGAGMSAEQLAGLFEPFGATGGARLGVAGSGLGLSLVKAIVELHGATLAIASTPGEGTCVTLSWPSAEQALDRGEQVVQVERLGQEGAGGELRQQVMEAIAIPPRDEQ